MLILYLLEYILSHLIDRDLTIVRSEHIKPLIVAENPIIFIFKYNELTDLSNIEVLLDLRNLFGSH